MKLWRWFVGQVARLRRSVVDVFGSGSQPHHAEDRLAADEHAPGPPADWVERVRRGAPGLLEPSLRRRGGPAESPPTRRVARSQTELDPEPESLEEPEHGYRTEPTVADRRPLAPLRIPLLRRVLRRVSPPSPFKATPRPASEPVPHELEPAARLVDEPADSPAVEPEASLGLDTATRRVEPNGSSPAEPGRRRLVGENMRSAASAPPVSDGLERSQAPPIPDKPERLQREPEPEPAEVVAFEAPVQRRTSGSERAANPGPPREARLARPAATNVVQADLARDERALEPSMPSPAPRRAYERPLEPFLTPPSPPQESSVDPPSPPLRRAEPLSELAAHPWPELPPPLDQPDSDVEAALRAWEHQRRLDLEQTRL